MMPDRSSYSSTVGKPAATSATPLFSRLCRSLVSPFMPPARPKRVIVLCAVIAGSLLMQGSDVRAVYPIYNVAPTNASSSSLSLFTPDLAVPTVITGNERAAPGEQQALSRFAPAPVLAKALDPAPASTTSARTGMTTDDNVNMRAGPGTNYRILAQLPVDTRAQIVDEQAGWYHILTPWGREGWVSAGLFEVAKDFPTDAQSPIIGSAGTVGAVNMRAGPGTGYPISDKLRDSTVLEVVALQGGWYKVRSPSGNVGWVAADYVPLDWIPDVYAGSSSGSSGSNAPPVAVAPSDVVRITQKYLNARYVWGGSDPSGFDCSGLTWYVYRQLGVLLPAGSAYQFSSRYGQYISEINALALGDLVFFERTTEETGITHVGIYVGNGKMIAARSERLGVRYVSLLDPFWSSRFAGGIRPYR